MASSHLSPGRHLAIEGASNVRDIGGYLTLDSRRTRWRTFLRGDSLHRLSPASQAALLDYGMRTVIDLRRTGELREAPNVFAGSPQVSYQHYNLQGDDPPTDTPGSPEGEEVSDKLLRGYRHWLDHRQSQIREILAALAEPSAPPVIFHCAAGKDRAGVIAALVLGIVGVPPETIAQDYALSARFLFAAALTERAASGEAVGDYPWERYQQKACPPEAMLKVLRYLEARYGGIEGYARTIGLSRQQIESLRNSLVE